LCNKSNGDDKDSSVLDAREQLFTLIATGGFGKYWSSGGAYSKEQGYAWAATLLAHFLGGSGQPLQILLSATDAFVNDPGITRATREFATPVSSDEADFIVPLLHDFLGNHVKPVAMSSSGDFSVGPVPLAGIDHYFNDPAKNVGLEPRAINNLGYWAAFGHVTIDGNFSVKGYLSCRLNGYLINYTAQYLIKDKYKWFPGKKTPFPFGPSGGTVWIPHEWEISLRDAGRAAEFDFTISWKEEARLFVTPDFTQYTQAAWWAW
jgi:hypothetical protein